MHWIMNTSLIKKLIILLIAFFTPIVPAMIACGLLITIDTITGIIGAKKAGEPISSKAFGRVITKMLVYQLLIISSHLVEQYLFTLVPFVKITLAFIGVTELISIGENFQKSTGKNFVKYLRTFLDEKFRGMLAVKDNKEDQTPPTI